MIPLMNTTFADEQRVKDELCAFIQGAEQLSCGPKVLEWEHAFATWQGRDYAVAFNSGSSANLALIQSLLNLNWLQPKDRVGFSAVTWATNVMPLMQLGLEPLPIDVRERSLNVGATWKPGTMRFVFLTHVLGLCDNLAVIQKVCESQGVTIIEDCCEAMGSVFQGTKLGNCGLASTFSTFVGHHLSTIEGGMVCTDNQELYSMLLMVRSHGWSRNLPEFERRGLREQYGRTSFEDRYTFYHLGYNLRPTELTGVLGLAQLDELKWSCGRRHLNFLKLRGAVATNPCLSVPEVSHMDRCSSFAFPVVAKTPEVRAALVDRCQAAGVEVRPLIAGNIVRQPFYAKYASTDVETPVADHIDRCGCYVPNRPDLTDDELDTIAEVVCG